MSAPFNANVNRYSDGIASEYTQEPLHRKRLQIAARLIEAESSVRPTPTLLVELASGGVPITGFMRRPSNLQYLSLDGAVFKDLPGHRQVACNLEEPWPIQDQAADILFAGDVIEHIFDTKHYLSEMRRVVKRGGLVVMTTPNLCAAQDRLRFLVGLHPRHIAPLHEYLWLHIRPFSKRGLMAACNEFGFSTEACWTNGFVWRGARRQCELVCATRLLPGLGNSLVLALRRR